MNAIYQPRSRISFPNSMGKTLMQLDFASIEIRVARLYGIDPGKPYDMIGKLAYEPGDYIRTKDGSKDLRICTGGGRWRTVDTDHSRLQVRVRKPGSRKSHWTWADRWVKASPLEALAAQAEDQHEIR